MSSSSNEAASKADDKSDRSLSITNLSRILAWGSTTGKLYLDDARLDDSESKGGVWNVSMRKAGGDGKDGSKENGDGNKGTLGPMRQMHRSRLDACADGAANNEGMAREGSNASTQLNIVSM